MGIPEFFVKGYGCGKTNSNSHEWASIMKVSEYSIPGVVSTNNGNILFECPDSFGILVRKFRGKKKYIIQLTCFVGYN